ncbi:FHA domain containing protein [Labilithrix luteola]|uniref:FHA domain containing protein n=1 Tax=Labilithrix luteola TaxID=1391654 RepID=A0A0K1Q9X6_9BACT|nr:FHA domain containing protein [Labilithrix luteola]
MDVPGVDEEHAKISEVALIAMGADCAVGDVPLDPGARRLLMPGDEIQIGSVVLAVEGDDPSIMPPPPDGSPRRARGPKVRVVEGKNFGDELLLEEEGKDYVIGRHAKSDLVIEDREVSREHLRLKRRGYDVFIHDLASTRGSWLGRAAVYSGATIEWTRPRMLRIGATVLSLEVPVEVRRQAPPAQPSAPMTPPPRRARSSPSSSSGIDNPPSSRAPGSLPPMSQPIAPSEVPTRRLAPYRPESIPTSAAGSIPPSMGGASAGMAVGAALVPGPTRKAWKQNGATFGKASGFALLALAGLAILGALFVVFSLLE